MTDDHTKSLEKKLPNNQVQSNGPKSQKVMTNSSTTTVSAQPKPNVTKTAEPQIKKVDIVIAGVTYPIYCPVHEQEELRSAVSYINNYALDLRKDAPSLSQENLLVLCCLNLYEKIHANQRDGEDRLQQDKQSEALLNKIMKDAQSIL
ncbi:cell division protein ZapA [Psychrobacter sp. AOP22-C1-C5]|uniref:cell division protein ZapA n=1 Tax=Psychrobacter sp. AOP22-C1-C5 TaxID=3457716 RepID=UPI004035F42B